MLHLTKERSPLNSMNLNIYVKKLDEKRSILNLKEKTINFSYRNFLQETPVFYVKEALKYNESNFSLFMRKYYQIEISEGTYVNKKFFNYIKEGVFGHKESIFYIRYPFQSPMELTIENENMYDFLKYLSRWKRRKFIKRLRIKEKTTEIPELADVIYNLMKN